MDPIYPLDRSVYKSIHLCVVEYTVQPENPLTFEQGAYVGSSVFGEHGSGGRVPETFSESLAMNALAIAAYEGLLPVFYGKGGLRISGGGWSFGWTIPLSAGRTESLSTDISLKESLPFRSSTTSTGCDRQYGDPVDPFAAAQRRLGLLSKAQLIGISEPPERQVVPYPKS